MHVHRADDAWAGTDAVHVKTIDMQKMRTLLSKRNALKRKDDDIENHIRGARRPRLLVGAGRSRSYEARIREMLERSESDFRDYHRRQ